MIKKQRRPMQEINSSSMADLETDETCPKQIFCDLSSLWLGPQSKMLQSYGVSSKSIREIASYDRLKCDKRIFVSDLPSKQNYHWCQKIYS